MWRRRRPLTLLVKTGAFVVKGGRRGNCLVVKKLEGGQGKDSRVGLARQPEFFTASSFGSAPDSRALMALFLLRRKTEKAPARVHSASDELN